MTTTTTTSAVATLIAAGTTCAPGTPQRGSVDLRTALSARITIKVTNGATGPTIAPSVNILMAHDTGVAPTLDSKGAVWKTLYSVTGNSTANSVLEWNYTPPIGCHVEVEIKDNTAQNVIVEAFATVVESAVSV